MGCASSKTAEDKADDKPNKKSNINKNSGSNGKSGKIWLINLIKYKSEYVIVKIKVQMQQT